MLLNLHVKNLALIEEVDIDFDKGLIVLTGETGAGKSLILGSVNIALGNKFTKDMIRAGKEFALVELTFSADEKSKKILQEYDINLEEDTITVSRKVNEGRSVSKINGETVNIAMLKTVMQSLVDIHGQHDHQSLLYKNKHLEILDKFAFGKEEGILKEVSDKYKEYQMLLENLKEFNMDETERTRELEFARFEVDEIDGAELMPGEDLELETEYKKSSNRQVTIENLSKINAIFSDRDGIAELIGNCVSLLSDVDSDEEEAKCIKDEIYNLEALVHDISREIYDFGSHLSYHPERLKEIEERLDTINHLKMKYGKSMEDIIAYREEKQKKIDSLTNYEENRSKIKNKIQNCEKELEKLSQKLSNARKQEALKLEALVIKALKELNFLQVDFKIEISRKNHFGEKGFDDVAFLISTNPGEPARSLGKVASGGELSRIMLALKSILADEDDVGTLIFDEIDTGISGKTAGMVAGKLALISRKRQVICISHLAQIASMADSHYLIEKNINNNETFTKIKKLNYDASIQELVRISDGGQITESAIIHAKEMKDMADRTKISQT